MYAILGITGQVGSAVARTLLERGANVRAVVRSPEKASAWAARGVELAPGDLENAPSLARALRDVEGAYVMLPPAFQPSPGFPEARKLVDSLARALSDAAPPKVVVLSSIGAERPDSVGILHGLHLLEAGLGATNRPIAFLRAGWFLENAAWDVAPARERGEIDSFLQPLDRAYPMVSTDDVGRVAAETLLEPWAGRRTLALEGPRRVSPHDLAAAFSAALARPVVAKVVPRDRWRSIFEAQGSPWPEPRIEMLDGFNTGWIDFTPTEGVEHRRGRVTHDEVVRRLVAG